MGEARSSNVRTNPPGDGLVCGDLKPHSRDKLFVLGYYLEEFTRSMHGRFPNLIYLDLYGGPGRGIFPSGETIDGSPIIAARTTPPFTKIIAAEADPRNAGVLEQRLRVEWPGGGFKVFARDCDDIVAELKAEIPKPKKVGGKWVGGVLTFCFVDPFDLGIRFSTLAAFKDLYIDLLVLIADQMSGGRPEHQLVRPSNTTIEHFLADPAWREDRKAQPQEAFRDYVHRKFTERMKGLGFLAGTPRRFYAQGTGVKLYRLCFFSKKELGIKFWERARKNAPSQGLLFE